jgi:hypothetical protein
MKKFIFETDIPSWANPTTLETRTNLYLQCGIDTVMLVVDDGNGATWPSNLIVRDPRISGTNPLKATIDYLHSRGLSVVPVLNVMGLVNPAAPIRPEFLLSNMVPPVYNVWDYNFIDWRSSYIAECISVCGGDALGLDYVRSVRGTWHGFIPAEDAVKAVLQKIKDKVSPHIRIMSITNSINNLPNTQGVNPVKWYQDGLVDLVCNFNYVTPIPVAELASVPDDKLWVLIANYETTGGQAYVKGPLEIERNARTVLKARNVAALGIYNSNQLKADHIPAIAHFNKML